jgi:hypothetical protein
MMDHIKSKLMERTKSQRSSGHLADVIPLRPQREKPPKPTG